MSESTDRFRWRRRPRFPRRVLRLIQERLYGRDPRWVDVWLRTAHLFSVGPTAVVDFGRLFQVYADSITDEETERLCQWAAPEVLAMYRRHYEEELAAGIPAEELEPPTEDDADEMACVIHATVMGAKFLQEWRVLEDCKVEQANPWSNGRKYPVSIGYALAADIQALWVRPQRMDVAAPAGVAFEDVIARDGGRCRYCGGAADAVDHLFPSSRGGPDEMWNLVASCRSCNSRKGDRTPGEAGMVVLPPLARGDGPNV
jgi:hypothetical protein